MRWPSYWQANQTRPLESISTCRVDTWAYCGGRTCFSISRPLAADHNVMETVTHFPNTVESSSNGGDVAECTTISAKVSGTESRPVAKELLQKTGMEVENGFRLHGMDRLPVHPGANRDGFIFREQHRGKIAGHSIPNSASSVMRGGFSAFGSPYGGYSRGNTLATT